MNARPRLWQYLAVMGCASLVGLQALAHAERRPNQATDVEQENRDKRINQQLDKILAVQETILKRYEELMEELQVVKVRASH